MAKSKRKSSKSGSGSTLFSVLFGLILGLAAAVAVALFVTKVPMPFVDKASRDPAKTLLPELRDAPDPNIGLYGRNGPAGTAPTGPTDTGPAPLPPVAQGKPNGSQDDIGSLIASLTAPSVPSDAKPAAQAGAAPTAPAQPGTAAPAKPAAGNGTSPPKPAQAAPTANANQTTYYLQAGAFRSEDDAQAMKARILLLGMPVQVLKAQVNGGTINRVRVGPFKGIDDMNRSRARLGAEKIDSSVVRP